MASAKAVSVVINSAASEVAKDKVLATSEASNGPAANDIIRDANGKVIEVRLTLPPDVSQAALDAIAATPGVANVVTEDIPPGFAGFDGSEASKDALIATGWEFAPDSGATDLTTEAFNASGQLVLTNPVQSVVSRDPSYTMVNVSEGMDADLNFYPIPGDFEIKMQMSNLSAANDWGMNLRWGQVVVGFSGLDATLAADTNFHTYKVESTGTSPDGGVSATFNLYRDGVLKQTQNRPISVTAPLKSIINVFVRNRLVAANVETDYTIDFMRWSKV